MRRPVKLPVIESKRVEGIPKTFYVFQGSTYDRERLGSYIWAPIRNKAGATEHHWERLQEVQPGDILFHGCDGKILAVSVARSCCYEAQQPDALQAEDQWEQAGRRVDCDYIQLESPLKTSDFRKDILEYSQGKYAPFNRKGDGNLGYLYDLPKTMAMIFMKALLRENTYLGDVPAIKTLLGAEENGVMTHAQPV